jgi:hypothetical protein
MKVLSLIELGVFALSVITFRNVAALPKLKPAAAAPFDWQQFLPQGKIITFCLFICNSPTLRVSHLSLRSYTSVDSS